MPVNNGTLIKEQNRPEIYLVHADQRHWIPDPATLMTKGSWSSVQTLPDADVAAIPLGNPVPSVIHPGTWPDNSLITAPPAPEVYVVKNGARSWIPDPATLFSNGYDWSAVETIPSSVLNAIPLGDPIPSVLTRPTNDIVIDTGADFLGAGHYVSTRLRLTRANGDLSGTNRTWTVTALGGFHAGLYIVLLDSDGIPVQRGQTPLLRYGVDGHWIGNSDRTDSFHLSIGPESASKVTEVRVFHTWAADSFQTILNKWVTAGKSIGELVAQAGQIVKVFTGK